MLRRCVWSRNIKNGCSIYIYDISRLRVKFGCGRFPPRSSRFIIHYLLSILYCVIWHKWKRRQINTWCTQLTVVYVIKQYNLHNGLIPPHRFLHVSGQPATATNEDELLYIYTHVVRWRHGDDGWLRGQNHVPERSALIHYLLDHVTRGHLHWHCDGRRRIRRHHRHSHRPCKEALRHVSRELTPWHKDK